MRMSGLEPMTPCMSSRYSNQLSYTLTTDIIIAYFTLFVNPFFQKIQNFFLSRQHRLIENQAMPANNILFIR